MWSRFFLEHSIDVGNSVDREMGFTVEDKHFVKWLKWDLPFKINISLNGCE